MSDHNLWKNDIQIRFNPLNFNEQAIGSGFVVQVDIGAVSTSSVWRMTLEDAYRNLRNRLLGGDDTLLPKSTTAQRDALKGIEDGTQLLNVDTKRAEVCFNAGWISSGGSSSGSIVAYGSMYADNSAGISVDLTTAYSGWVTANAGSFDKNKIVSFVNVPDFITGGIGDRLHVGIGGAGFYMVEFHASFTSQGNKLTTAAIHQDGIEQPTVKMALNGRNLEAFHLASAGPLFLQDQHVIDLRFKSTGNDTIKIYQVNVNIDRIELP